MQTKYEKVLLLAKPYLKKGSALRHTLLALKFALKLLKEGGGDPDVVIPAVILHDTGYSKVRLRWTQVDSGAKVPEHMLESTRIAEQILKETFYPADKAQEVLDIVKSHDKMPLPLNTKNAKVFKDADRLSGYFTHFGLSVITKQKNKNAKEVLSDVENKLPLFLTSTGIMIATTQLKKLKDKIINHN